VIEKNFPLVQALGTDGKLAMASVDTVPAGKYGKAALTYLGVWQGIGAWILIGSRSDRRTDHTACDDLIA
jgi:ABC-type molybdate transport system substrate-binding protein